MRVPRWPSHCRRKTSWYCGRSIETVENMSSRLADAIFVATRTTSSREASTGVCCASARTSLIRLTAVGGSLSVKLLLAVPAWLGSPRRSACRCFEACRANAWAAGIALVWVGGYSAIIMAGANQTTSKSLAEHTTARYTRSEWDPRVRHAPTLTPTLTLR